jgi:VanZ family protein
MLYAASDEWHQTFIEGRVGCVTDVIIDTCGSILGVIVYKLFKRIKRVK